MVLDIDGDGQKDIVYTTSADQNPGRGAIIRNLGNRSFATPVFTMYAESEWLDNHSSDSQAALVKLNGPNDYHLSFTNTTSQNHGWQSSSVVVGFDKLGTFGQRLSLFSENDSFTYPVELDGDHRTEFFARIGRPDGRGAFSIWDRQPDASYLSQSFLVDRNFNSDRMLVLDLDGDADLDLLFLERLDVIERTGLRTFSSVVRSLHSMAAEPQFKDLNGDGLPDAYWFKDEVIKWRLNLGNFLFGTEQSRKFDFPGGGFVDLVSIEPRPTAPAVIYLAEESNMQFELHGLRFGTWDMISGSIIHLEEIRQKNGVYLDRDYIALQDFDQDGRLDLLLKFNTSYPIIRGPDYPRLAMAWGTAGGSSSAKWIHPEPISYVTTLVKDFDRDGDIDLIHGPDASGDYWFSPNSGNGAFPNPVRLGEITPPSIANTEISISGIHTADLNGDSILDLVVDYTLQRFVHYSQALGVALGLGNGRFSSAILPSGSFDFMASEVYGVTQLIDWDQDGDLDAMGSGAWRENLGGEFSHEIRLIAEINNTTDSLGNPIYLSVNVVGDIDGDGFPDILALNYRTIPPPPGSAAGTPAAYVTGILFNDGLGGIDSIAELNTAGVLSDSIGNLLLGRVAIADMNLDGRNDLIIEELNMSDELGNLIPRIRWLRNPGGGSRNPAAWVSLSLGSRIMPSDLLLDFNGDQQLEWVDRSGYLRPTTRGPAVSPIYKFRGGVHFPRHFRSYPADFDGDGDADFLMTDSSDDATLLFNPLVDERSAITYHLIAANVKPNRAGPDQDADLDGRDNQTELIYGTNPLLSDAAPINPLAVGLQESLTYRTPQYAASLSLNYQVQKSTNLKDWVDYIPPQNPASHTSSGWNYFSVPVEKVGPSGYFRIKGWHALD